MKRSGFDRHIGRVFGVVALALLTHLWWRAGRTGEWTGPYLEAASARAGVARDLALLLFFFGSHSLFASESFKNVTGLKGPTQRRLFLILTFAATAITWTYWAPLPAPVWDFDFPLSLPLLALQGTGLVGLAWTYSKFDLGEFFGSHGARSAGLVKSGPFALCRHPSYFFTLLVLVSPTMPLGRAVLAGGIVVYIFVGSRLEERKLEREWGESYRRYRATTPWLIPTPRSILNFLKTST